MLLCICTETSQFNYLVICLIGTIPYHVFRFLGLEPGGDRVFYLGQGFYPARLYLFKLDNVPAETGQHRLADLTFLHGEYGFLKGFYHHAPAKKTKISAISGAPGILGIFPGQFCKVFALFDPVTNLFRLFSDFFCIIFIRVPGYLEQYVSCTPLFLNFIFIPVILVVGLYLRIRHVGIINIIGLFKEQIAQIYLGLCHVVLTM